MSFIYLLIALAFFSAPSYAKTKVEIPGARGYQVPANLFFPTSSIPTSPAILLQFGAQGDKDVDYIIEIAESMVAKGFVVLIMDMPGRGERAASSPEPSSNEDKVRWYMEDYEAGVDYLQSLEEVNPDQISFIGTSLGAITGIPFCAKDQRIKSCVSIVGGGNVPSSLPPELDCVQTVGSISPRATMLINGTLDYIIPYSAANNLHQRVGEPSEKVWLTADHYLRGTDKPGLYEKIASFIRRNS